jgi:hypothetical protein
MQWRDQLHIPQHAGQGSLTYTKNSGQGSVTHTTACRRGISYTYPSTQGRGHLHTPQHAGPGISYTYNRMKGKNHLHSPQDAGLEILFMSVFLITCTAFWDDKKKDISKLEKTIDLIFAVKNKESFNTLSYNY